MRTRIAWHRIWPALALVLVVAPLVAQGSDDPSCPDSLPVLDAAQAGCAPDDSTIDDVESGRDAIDDVRDADDLDVPDGWTTDEVVDVLHEDDELHFDGDAGLFYADELDHLISEGRVVAPPPAVATPSSRRAAGPSSRVPALHSKPDASRVVLLDFDGHTTTGTSWNQMTGGTIVSAPFDLDGNNAMWSRAEQQAIENIWARVAEDFAPFDVDVTTEDPGSAALAMTSRRDDHHGIRVVVSPSNWYSSGIGGIAYVGSFSSSTDMPAFVFSASLGNVESFIAEAVAHETGHTMGLRHDGTTREPYYRGHGTWAPIMGVGYGASVVQWSRGEYGAANNPEDDLSVIQNYLQIAPDDHGDGISDGTPLTAGRRARGVIATADDVDAFVLEVDDVALTVTVSGSSPSPDLDAVLTLRDADGRIIATSAPSRSLNASITRSVSAGRYVITVDGGSTGDPLTGWSDYGSLGRYTVQTSVTPLLSPLPVITGPLKVRVGEAVPLDATSSRDPDGGRIARYRWSVEGGTRSRAGGPALTSAQWSAPGEYTVRLTVVDDDGQTASTERVIIVRSAKHHRSR